MNWLHVTLLAPTNDRPQVFRPALESIAAQNGRSYMRIEGRSYGSFLRKTAANRCTPVPKTAIFICTNGGSCRLICIIEQWLFYLNTRDGHARLVRR